MYFEPRVLHTPAELCIRMITKIHKLGRYWRNFTKGTPNWSENLPKYTLFEGINRNFDLFLAEYGNL